MLPVGKFYSRFIGLCLGRRVWPADYNAHTIVAIFLHISTEKEGKDSCSEKSI